MSKPVKSPHTTPAPEGLQGLAEGGPSRRLLAALLAALLFWGSASSAWAGVHGPWGGGGGSPFNEPAPAGSQLAEVWVREGRVIDAILLVWRRPDGVLIYSPWYGGGGGRIQKFQFAPGERLVRVEGRAGRYVDSLRFITSTGRASPTYGGGGGAPFVSDAGTGEITGAFGRSGKLLDQIGFYTRP
jgi:hypothetical protein